MTDAEAASACFGKEAYQTRTLAQVVLDRRRKRGQHLVAYRCPVCHDWHLGRRFAPSGKFTRRKKQ